MNEFNTLLKNNPDFIFTLSAINFLLFIFLIWVTKIVVKAYITRSIQADYNKKLEKYKNSINATQDLYTMVIDLKSDLKVLYMDIVEDQVATSLKRCENLKNIFEQKEPWIEDPQKEEFEKLIKEFESVIGRLYRSILTRKRLPENYKNLTSEQKQIFNNKIEEFRTSEDMFNNFVEKELNNKIQKLKKTISL